MLAKLNTLAATLRKKQFPVSVGINRFGDYIAVDKNGNDLVRGTYEEVCTVLENIVEMNMRGWK